MSEYPGVWNLSVSVFIGHFVLAIDLGPGHT